MRINLSVPYYNEISAATVMSLLSAKDWALSKGHELNVIFFSTSATPFCFNQLLCNAIHSDCDYWVMLHSDLAAKQNNWLEILLKDMEAEGLEVISAVAPIKNEIGLTSTGVNTSDSFPRRLTLKEIHAGPEVITNEKCKRLHGESLLINTGMMVWDMAVMRNHAHELPFEFIDYLEPETTSLGLMMKPHFIPEDWLMSRRLDIKGIKFGATRNVTTIHRGAKEFDSTPWGQDIDPQWERKTKKSK